MRHGNASSEYPPLFVCCGGTQMRLSQRIVLLIEVRDLQAIMWDLQGIIWDL